MKKNYVYPAIFSYDDDGISISFPDLPGALSCGYSDIEALEMAKECLELHLFNMEEDGDLIPEPTAFKDIKIKDNEIITLIKADMVLVRRELNNKPIKKTLTIPKWINDLGVEKHVNFSELLRKALLKELDLSDINKETL